MSNLLEASFLDISETLEELRAYWLENSESTYNPTAFTKIKTAGSNIMCCCPYHSETNPSFGIKTDYPYTFQCFGCGKSGNISQLVAYVVKLPTEAHGEHFLLKNFIMISSNNTIQPLNLESILDNKERDRKCSLLDHEVDKYKNERHPYLYSRGFKEITLNKYEVGYDKETRSIAIPIRDLQGHVRFIKKRFVDQKGFLNTKDIFKKDIVYGLYYITQSKNQIYEIYLNESETDTMSCYQGGLPAGAILGRILFKEQVHNLLKSNIKTVNLFYDNDKAGVECTLKSYEALKSTPIKVNVVIYPGATYGINTLDEEDIVFKDANDLLRNNVISEIKKVSYLEWLTMVKI